MSTEIDFDWATNANHSAGADPWSGQPNKVKPAASRETDGLIPGDTPSAEELNYMFHRLIRNAKIIEAARVFNPDNWSNLPSFSTGMNAMIVNGDWRRFMGVTATQLHRAQNGHSYNYNVSTHGETSGSMLAYRPASGRIFILGSTNTPRISPDQATPSWSDHGALPHSEVNHDCILHPGLASIQDPIIVVSDGGKIDHSSGLAWTDAIDIGSEDLKQIVSGNGVLVASHNQPTDGLVVSTDHGLTWGNESLASITTPTDEHYQVAYVEAPLQGGDMWIAVGREKVYTSVDSAATWVDRTSEYQLISRGGSVTTTPDFRTLKKSIATDGRYIYAMIGAAATGPYEVVWSMDGVTWFTTGIKSDSASKLFSMIPPGGLGGGHVIYANGANAIRTPDIRFSEASPILYP